jgi:AcrR family transcriptional regulator
MSVTLPEVGHRERKKQRTKEQLIQAALRLFAEHGFEETTIDAICAEVGLVPRTFFRYFGSKDDALFAWFDGMRARGVAALRSRPRREGVVTAAAAALDEVIEAHAPNDRFIVILHRLSAKSPDVHARHAALRHTFQRTFASTLASRLRPTDALIAEIVAAAIVAAYSVAVDQWAAGGARRRLQHYSGKTFAKARKALRPLDKQYVLR